VRLAVASLLITPEQRAVDFVTRPFREAYARRIGASLVDISEGRYGSHPLGYEKLQLRDILKRFDRVIYLSPCCLVRPDAPDLFAVVPLEKVGAFNEGRYLPERGSGDRKYFNTEVLVLARGHEGILEDPSTFDEPLGERAYINLQLKAKGCDTRELEYVFNRTSLLDGFVPEDRLCAYVVHYAGLDDALRSARAQGIADEEVLRILHEDIAIWESRRPDFLPRETYKIAMNGGLGDQVDAEPVVRELRRLYPRARLIVGSTWPELFQDLDYEVESVDIWKDPDPPEVSRVFYTYVMPDDPARQYLCPTFSHTTDYGSQLALQRILPPERKSIELRYRIDHSNTLRTKIPDGWDLGRSVVFHAGASWPTRTLLPEVCANFVREAAARWPVILVGSGEGVQPLAAPAGVLDLRDRLSLKETLALLDHAWALVTNDSGTLHLAGATDIWILAFFSARHPAFVWPFRYGSQDYKTIALNSRPQCWPCGGNVPPTRGWGHVVSECMNWDAPLCCHPSAERLLEGLREAAHRELQDRSLLGRKGRALKRQLTDRAAQELSSAN
jgi:hypothetical protein